MPKSCTSSMWDSQVSGCQLAASKLSKAQRIFCGLELAKYPLGFRELRRRQLASADLAVPHAGCAAFRHASRVPPFDQPAAAFGQYIITFCLLKPTYGRVFAERVGGRALWSS